VRLCTLKLHSSLAARLVATQFIARYAVKFYTVVTEKDAKRFDRRYHRIVKIDKITDRESVEAVNVEDIFAV
jgi:hypothetical protein